MSKQQTARAEDVPTSDQPVSPEISDRLKAFGFDPGIKVYSVEGVDFDVDLLKQALFDSTYKQPVTIPFRSERISLQGTALANGLGMVVELVQVYYCPREPHVGSGLLGCYNEPEWYVRGFLDKSGIDSNSEVIRMHVYLEVDGSEEHKAGKINRAIVQIVHRPSGADPATQLIYAHGLWR